jgi:hypothetical protein
MWNPPSALSPEEQQMAARTQKARKCFVFLRTRRPEYMSLSRLSCKCIQGLANREVWHKRWRLWCLLASEAQQA